MRTSEWTSVGNDPRRHDVKKEDLPGSAPTSSLSSSALICLEYLKDCVSGGVLTSPHPFRTLNESPSAAERDSTKSDNLAAISHTLQTLDGAAAADGEFAC
ncbi:unnamed protein product [Pleuronectes platessa]|uniref:Uncharacterized protein n=1 Tax=Pleuronectes platessa TaxID=8262 RepID=A0A9N7UXS7_PLEPL|nr:unnamed protein product [Pleuronectes platessa]